MNTIKLIVSVTMISMLSVIGGLFAMEEQPLLAASFNQLKSVVCSMPLLERQWFINHVSCYFNGLIPVSEREGAVSRIPEIVDDISTSREVAQYLKDLVAYTSEVLNSLQTANFSPSEYKLLCNERGLGRLKDASPYGRNGFGWHYLNGSKYKWLYSPAIGTPMENVVKAVGEVVQRLAPCARVNQIKQWFLAAQGQEGSIDQIKALFQADNQQATIYETFSSEEVITRLINFWTPKLQRLNVVADYFESVDLAI